MNKEKIMFSKLKNKWFVLLLIIFFVFAILTVLLINLRSPPTIEGAQIWQVAYPVGRQLEIGHVYLDKPGYVVVQKEIDGKPGPVIINSNLISGEKYGIALSLNKAVMGDKIFIILYYDDGDGKFDFSKDNLPAKVNGKIVMVRAEIYM